MYSSATPHQPSQDRSARDQPHQPHQHQPHQGRPPARPLLDSIFAKTRAEGVIAEVEAVTTTMRRILIVSDAASGSQVPPGRHLRIQINDPLSFYGIVRPSETLRTYTIRWHEPARRTFEIWAHLYEGDGIGLRWVRQVSVGDPIVFWGPSGDFDLEPSAPYHLLVGEETAAAAFWPMLDALGPDARTFGVLESESKADEVPVPYAAHFVRVHRQGRSAVTSETLIRAVTELELPAEPGFAYLAGEARTAQAIRQHLVRDRGWSSRSVRVKPFWTPGKKGLHH